MTLVPNPGILTIEPYVAGKSKAAPGVTPVKLSSNENPFGPSPAAIAAYRVAEQSLHRYPDPAHGKLREAIAEVQGLDAARIVCGAGSDELIGLLVHGYAGAGDEVLISEHGFSMYKIYTLAAGATPVFVREKNLTFDVDAMLAAVTSRTKIVFIANPNNPTGTYISATEVKRLRDGLPPNVLLIIDGAYSEYVTAGDYTDGRELVDAGDNTVMLRTFSKIYGLPSLRIGWGYFPASIADVLSRIRGPFNLSTPSIEAGAAAMREVDYTERMKAHNTQWLGWLTAELQALGIAVQPSQGNFLLAEFANASAVNAHLLEQGLIVREVGNYGLPKHLRITIGTEEELRRLVDLLKAFLRP